MRDREPARHQLATWTNSLMRRLEVLGNVAALQVDPEPHRFAAATRSRNRDLQRCFGFGFAGSGIVGCVALPFLLFLNPDPPRFNAFSLVSEASAALAPLWFETAAAPLRRVTLNSASDDPFAVGLLSRDPATDGRQLWWKLPMSR